MDSLLTKYRRRVSPKAPLIAGIGTFLIVVVAAVVSAGLQPVNIPPGNRIILLGLLAGMWSGVAVAGLLWVFSHRSPGTVTETKTSAKRGVSNSLLIQAGAGTFVI